MPIFFNDSIHTTNCVLQVNDKVQYAHKDGGYVFSRAALKAFSSRKEGDCVEDGLKEDEDLGRCMAKLGVRLGDSRDALYRARFNPFKHKIMINDHLPVWYQQFSAYKSDKVVSITSTTYL